MLGESCSKLIKDKKLLSGIFTTGLNISFVLIALNLLSVNFSISEAQYMIVITILLMAGLLIANISFSKLYSAILKYKSEKNYFRKTLVGVILIIFSFFILFSTRLQMLWLVSIPLMLSGLDILLNGLKIQRKELYLLSVASFFYAIVYIIIQTTSVIWFALQKFSLLFSKAIGTIVGKEILLGPSTSGILILIIFLIFGCCVFFLTGMKKRLFVSYKIGLLLFWIGYLIALSLIEFESKSDVVHYHLLFFFLCLIPTFLYLLKVKIVTSLPKASKIRGFKFEKLTEKSVALALVLILVAGIFITTFPSSNNNNSEEQKNILFYGHEMLGSWDVPEYGKYGKMGSGMFGLLPYYMNLSGYGSTIVVANETEFMETNFPKDLLLSAYENQAEDLGVNETDLANETASANNTITRFINFTNYTTIIESETLTADIFSNIDVFVLINFNGTFSETEQKIIWDFVENGGGLLVLGDHTNIGGMQNPLNVLLGPTGIRYRFDSALPIDSDFKWMPCYSQLHHPTMYNVDSMDEIQISVGASLDIGPKTFPMLTGRYGLSDIGDKLNSEGAYLGDYEYNEGEQIGDIILAAGEYYGSGRVMVFGDTSSYQNSAIASSLPLLQSAFNWLSSNRNATLEYAQIIISIIMFVVAAIIYLKSKVDNITFALFPMFLCIALILSAFLNPALLGEAEIQGNIIYIDSSHNERFNLQPYEDDSLSGFMLNMMRNDYLPVMMREFSDEKIENCDIVVFNAPTKKFSGSEVNSIMDYIEGGGMVILATGFDDKAASMPLLNEFGLDIEEIPLGPIPYVEEDPEFYQKDPRFVDGWPIIGDLVNENKFYNITIADEEYVLIYFAPYGQGGFLLISDSMYLMDENIESLYDYWPGNIQFLFNILDELDDKGLLNKEAEK